MWASTSQIDGGEKFPNVWWHHRQQNKRSHIHHNARQTFSRSWRGRCIDLRRENQSKSKWSSVKAGRNGCIYCMSTVKWFLSHHLKDCWGRSPSNPPAKCQTEFWTQCGDDHLTLWSNNFKIELFDQNDHHYGGQKKKRLVFDAPTCRSGRRETGW